MTSAAAHGLKSSRQPHVGPAAGIDQQYPRDLPVVGCLLRPASLSLSALRSARSSGGISETRSLSPTTAGERGLGLVTAIARKAEVHPRSCYVAEVPEAVIQK
ncbi:MAG: hypothetical protein WCE36_17110, partial [Pseudolabrys sp.]